MNELADPLVSVIVPCRNEKKWIGHCLESILANDFPSDRLEILVVDGMSDDGTREAIASLSQRYKNIRLVDNPQKITPTALNSGIKQSRGSIVMRMDAHVDYPSDYIRRLVDLLEASKADNVGGLCQTEPATDTAMARAIAIGMSHPLGVGNSYFRIGTTEDRWVDTVPFGCYRKEVFTRIGLFDVELVRNQDDEFNLRLIRSGGRILLTPKVVCRYYARDTLAKLWRMYYQYGYYKPLVVRKVGRVMTLRQLLPALLIVGLIAGCLLAVMGISERGTWPASLCASLVAPVLALVTLYFAALSACAVVIAPRGGTAVALCCFPVFATLHFSYGFGYLAGLAHLATGRWNIADDASKVPISR